MLTLIQPTKRLYFFMSNLKQNIKSILKYGLGSLLIILIVAVSVFAQKDIPKVNLIKKYATGNSKFMPIMGMQVHYRDEGNPLDSIPLVLIHGTSSSLHTREKVTTLLNDAKFGNKRVISLDMPAFGLTGPNIENSYGYDNYTQVIDSLLIKLNVKKCIIGGNSLGGGIAWHYAITLPQKVSKLILIDASGYPKKNERGSLGFKIAQMPVINNLLLFITPKSLVRKSIEGVYYDQKLIEEATVTRYHELLLCEGNRKAALSLFKHPFTQNTELIKTIETPTLFIWGREDGLINVENAYQFNKDIKNSQLVIFDKVGHVPNEEAPQKVAEAIYEFIKLRNQ
jgi:pimeloyl-ACP methyl ester carboxylesterase